MLDIGWPELMVVAAVTVVVVGPREIPRVLRTVNGYVRKVKMVASDFQSSMEDMAREADLEDLKKEMESAKGNFSGDFDKTIDPTGEVSQTINDIKDSVKEPEEFKKKPDISSPSGTQKADSQQTDSRTDNPSGAENKK